MVLTPTSYHYGIIETLKSLFVDLVNSYFMINPIWRNGYERKEAMVN